MFLRINKDNSCTYKYFINSDFYLAIDTEVKCMIINYEKKFLQLILTNKHY